ncbi:MAG: DegV family protein [Bacillota bacterium]
MHDYVIITDATADLPVEILNKLSVDVVPMQFQIGEDNFTHYPDAREMSFHDFYERLSSGDLATTSQINAYTYTEFFTPYLQKGLDILYIAFSSGLSGTYNASTIAAQELMEKYPERKVYCIDSLCTSVGEGMLVYYAALKKQEGLDIDQLKEWVEKTRGTICHWFTLYDINYLRRSGRVNLLVAGLASMLSIKPVLHVDDLGFLVAVGKARGRKKALTALVEQMEKTCVNPEEQVVFIGHGDYEEDAIYVADLIRSKFKVKDIIITHIGPIIGAHTGPGVLSIFFFGNKR